MIILGIDPGIAIVGYGVIEYTGNKFRVLDYNAVVTPKEDPLALRLKTIYEQIGTVIDTYKPDFVSIEELFYNNNQKTVISVAHGRGVCILAATNRNIPVFEYTPLQVKQAVVGYGRADKKQIQQMVKAILNLNVVPKPDDVADGLALAICHAHSHRMQSLTGLSGKQTV